MNPSANKRVAIYRRVSTTEQEENYSPDNQEKRCREWCVARGYSAVADEFDAHSGYKLKRPGLDRVRTLIRQEAIDILLVWRLDRLTRRMWHLPTILEEAEQHHVAIQSVTEAIDTSTPVGKFTVMGIVFAAEMERDAFIQRSASGRRNRIEAGKPPVGPRPPYGYRWLEGEMTRKGGREKIALEPNPVTAPIAVRIWESLARGVSQRGICKMLTSEGIPTPKGGRIWDKSTIQCMLDNPIYWGEHAAYRWRWTEETRTDRFTGEMRIVKILSHSEKAEQVSVDRKVAPPLVSPEIADAALARVAENNIANPRGNLTPEKYLLRGGFLVCGHCGRVMSCRLQRNRRTGKARLQYRCTTKCTTPGLCINNTIEQPVVDRPVWDKVAEVLSHPEIVEEELEKLAAETGENATRHCEELKTQAQEIERQRAKLARAVAILDDAEASAPLLAELKSLSNQASAIRQEQQRAQEQYTAWDLAQQAMKQLTAWCSEAALRSEINELSHDEKQLALRALGVRVECWKAGHNPRFVLRMRPLGQEREEYQFTIERKRAVCTTGDMLVRMSPGSTQ